MEISQFLRMYPDRAGCSRLVQRRLQLGISKAGATEVEMDV